MKPDLDQPDHIQQFVESFYARLLADTQLAPLFLDVAHIDLSTHLPRIAAFWRKLLLGDLSYQRHMMNQHRLIHTQQAFSASDFQRWLQHFEHALDAQFEGPTTERARRLGHNIAANLEEALLRPAEFEQRRH